MTSKDKTIAIVGAGPAGLVAARFLKAQGFEPTLFERGTRVGGQWDHAAATSGIWPDMRTNTSRILTRFSDLDYPQGVGIFPRNQDVWRYLDDYAHHFGLLGHVYLGATVEKLSTSASGGYELAWRSPRGILHTESFCRVVVASGFCNTPRIPKVAGLPAFTGAGGAIHSFDYPGAEAYRGQKVLVAGANISALEIAAELAMAGAASVTVAQRRQRYVIPKLFAGTPTDNLAFTRFNALAAESLPMDAVAAGLKDFVLSIGGNPAMLGAPAPHENIFAAGVAQSQTFLPLLAEGRIALRPWIDAMDGRTVRFTDGEEEEFDAIIFGTGYQPSLPFLDDGIKAQLRMGEPGSGLSYFTWCRGLPGLAFLGLFPLIGPYFPVLELQARYLAYTWGDIIEAPSQEVFLAGEEMTRAFPPEPPLHAMALLFARLIGAEPDLSAWPNIARALLFGPLTAQAFRLQGPDALPGVESGVTSEAATCGAVTDPAFTPQEREQLTALAAAQGNPDLDPRVIGQSRAKAA